MSLCRDGSLHEEVSIQELGEKRVDFRDEAGKKNYQINTSPHLALYLAASKSLNQLCFLIPSLHLYLQVLKETWRGPNEIKWTLYLPVVLDLLL